MLQLLAPSIENGPSGTLKLYKSYQAYEFNPLGMTRNMTSPLGAGAAAMQLSYKVLPACLHACLPAQGGVRQNQRRDAAPPSPLSLNRSRSKMCAS